jgi:hypothetical protein
VTDVMLRSSSGELGDGFDRGLNDLIILAQVVCQVCFNTCTGLPFYYLQ